MLLAFKRLASLDNMLKPPPTPPSPPHPPPPFLSHALSLSMCLGNDKHTDGRERHRVKLSSGGRPERSSWSHHTPLPPQERDTLPQPVSSTPSIPQDESTSGEEWDDAVPFTITLDMDFNCIGDKEEFKRDVINDVAAAGKIDAKHVKVTALRAGSVIVDMLIAKAAAGDVYNTLQDLEKQLMSPNSLFMKLTSSSSSSSSPASISSISRIASSQPAPANMTSWFGGGVHNICVRVCDIQDTLLTLSKQIYVYAFCVELFEYFDFPQTDSRNQNIRRAPHRKHTHIFFVSSVSEFVMHNVALLAQIHSYL